TSRGDDGRSFASRYGDAIAELHLARREEGQGSKADVLGIGNIDAARLRGRTGRREELSLRGRGPSFLLCRRAAGERERRGRYDESTPDPMRVSHALMVP